MDNFGYTVNEAAEMIEMSTHQIYKLIKEKKITSNARSEKMTRIPADSIQKSFSIKTAKKMLTMTDKTLRNLIADGKIAVKNYGERLTRITEDEINKYIKNITVAEKIK